MQSTIGRASKKSGPWIIGMMSGTSMDGIDIAAIKCIDMELTEIGYSDFVPYDDAISSILTAAIRRAKDLSERAFEKVSILNDPIIQKAQNDITMAHIKAYNTFLDHSDLMNEDIGTIGVHGQTILHKPELGWTIQLLDAALLYEATKTPVLYDFRENDMLNGGQGAPLVPIFHEALVRYHNFSTPCCFVNIGGVANMTYLGRDDGILIGFDTGPGNGLLNDWMSMKTGAPYDENGATARNGTVDHPLLQKWLCHPYFSQMPPKSLDRFQFADVDVSHLSVEDGAATLTELTSITILKGLNVLPENPKQVIICGGGAKNKYLMERLTDIIPMPVMSSSDLDLDPDFIEAQAFAYLAHCHEMGRPITFPSTTGCSYPIGGGKLYNGQ